jgi:hypothetical protein
LTPPSAQIIPTCVIRAGSDEIRKAGRSRGYSRDIRWPQFLTVRNGSQDSASADGIATASTPGVTMSTRETTMAWSGSKLDSPRATSGAHGEWRNSPAGTCVRRTRGIVHARNKCLSPVPLCAMTGPAPRWTGMPRTSSLPTSPEPLGNRAELVRVAGFDQADQLRATVTRPITREPPICVAARQLMISSRAAPIWSF